VLDYAHAYFQLGPIERRIYEVARASGAQMMAGREDEERTAATGEGAAEDGTLDLDLATFRLQVGYQNPLANFRAALRGIAGSDAIPGYRVELVETVGNPDAGEGAPRAGRGRRSNPTRVVITPRDESERNDDDPMPVEAGFEAGSESPGESRNRGLESESTKAG